MSDDGVLAVFSSAILCVGLVGLLVWGMQRDKARQEIWRRFAESRGGRFHAVESLFATRSASMELEHRGVPVLVDTYVVSHGKSSTTYTRARASVALGAGPVFSVYREGLLASFGKALGTQDVELGGDAQFDTTFMVKCDEPDAVRRVWTLSLRGSMLRSLEHARASSDGTTVTLVVVGAEENTSTLGALVEVTAALAGEGLVQLADLSGLPGARYVPPSGRWDARSAPRLELDVQGVVVTLDARGSAQGLRVELAAQAARELPPIAAAIDASGAVTGEVPRDLLPAPRALAAIGGARLSASGAAIRLRFTPGRFPGPAPVTAAAELLAALARAPGSAFR